MENVDISTIIEGWDEFNQEEKREFFILNMRELNGDEEFVKSVLITLFTNLVTKAYKSLYLSENKEKYEYCSQARDFISDLQTIYRELIPSPTQDEEFYLFALGLTIEHDHLTQLQK